MDKSKSMTTYIADVKIDIDSTYDSVLKKIDDLVRGEGCHYITTTNPEFILAAQKDIEFKNILNAAAISTPDGSGILMAHHYLSSISAVKKNFWFPLLALIKGIQSGYSTPLNTVTGQDLIYKICKHAEQKNYSVFFLGGGNNSKIDVAQQAASNLRILFPNLHIIGATSKFNFTTQDDATSQQYIKGCMQKHKINSLDILFVAYGQQKQEKWIVRNSCSINVKVSMGVGGALDVISGIKQRAPHSWRSIGLEWFYRLLQEPSRFHRIINATVVFPLYIFLISLRRQK